MSISVKFDSTVSPIYLHKMKPSKNKEPQPVEVLGNTLKCPVCGNDSFWNRKAQLNTALLSFFNLDWANRNATCFVCSECTHISWFLG